MIGTIISKISEYKPNEENFVPFEITFTLQTPIVLSHPWINFDGIIAHILLRKILGALFRSLPTNMPVEVFSRLRLPIKRTHACGYTIYHASISFFEYNNFFATTIYKRFDNKHISLVKLKHKKIRRGSGHFKDYMIRLAYIPTKTVLFYANGDVEEIASLIDALPGLGKKVAIGYGFVKSYTINEIDEDISIINEGLAMRPIPVDLIDMHRHPTDATMLAYKFPYWAKQNVTLCVPPGEKIWMKNGELFS